MIFSLTGIVYLLAFLAVGLLAYRLFQYWQREKTTTAKFFFFFTASFALMMLVTAIGGLFFAKNTPILIWVVILTVFFQSFALAFIAYLIMHLKFPRISPWTGFTVIFALGLLVTVFTAVIPFEPYLEPSGGINWNIQSMAGVFRGFLFSIPFLLLVVILIQQIRASEKHFIKTKALGMVIILIFGLLIGFFDFFLGKILKLEAISRDIVMGTLAVVTFVLVFLTQKAPPKIEKKEYIPPSLPKISW